MENKENVWVSSNPVKTMAPMAEAFLSCTELFCEPPIEMEVMKPETKYPMLPKVAQVAARPDPRILADQRVLANLLRAELRYMPRNIDYFATVQVEVKPHMRKIVADWMLEVVQECCVPDVFCLATSLMDRFLAKVRIQKNQLQLLGAVCLFLASKFKESSPLTSDRLAMYTDFSVTVEDIREWELLVLYKLKWDLGSATGLDFLDHVLPRLPIHPATDLAVLRRQVETAVALSSTLYSFSYIRPSVVAASSTALALRSMSPKFTEGGARSFLAALQEVTRSSTEELEHCTNLLLATLPPYLTQVAAPTDGHTALVTNFEKTSLLVKSC